MRHAAAPQRRRGVCLDTGGAAIRKTRCALHAGHEPTADRSAPADRRGLSAAAKLRYAAAAAGLLPAGAGRALAHPAGPLALGRPDMGSAINEVGRMVFSRDALMGWVVGVGFTASSGAGIVGCFVGVFVTLPWMISASAVAYRDLFGIDDPNRTNQ